MSTLAQSWHRTPSAAAIISRVKEAEVARVSQLSIPVDYEAFAPLTDRAGEQLDRLEAIRTDMVSRTIGYTFADTMKPYDEARAKAWLAVFGQAPTVFEVLRDEFAGRVGRSVAA